MPLMQIVQLIRNREEGQALVEYALILSLVSIAAIGILAESSGRCFQSCTR